MKKPKLFGIKNSNRDFTLKDSWGKNNFNSSFPASLCSYLHSQNLKANYLNTDSNGNFLVETISISDVFGIDPSNEDDIFYAFESGYPDYNTYVIGSLPRTDLVIQNHKNKKCTRALEVKLTALPDNSTFDKTEDKWGSEIVVRPDTIVYLACSIIDSLNENIPAFCLPNLGIQDWEDPEEILNSANVMMESLEQIIEEVHGEEYPVLIQPVWKTNGKSPSLAENCLDVFVWSNIGFLKFIIEIGKKELGTKNPKINRQIRTSIWLYKMLFDYKNNNAFNHENIIDKLSYNVKNDKAFSSQGRVNNPFMTCENLTKPRITKSEVKNIILNNGQDLLSPERRFDAIIFNSPSLFL